MHQSIPGASLPPPYHPPATVGHLPTLPVLGGGALAHFPHGSAFANPGPPPFSRCSYVHPYPNITKHGGFSWKHKQIQSLTNLIREILSLVKVFKGMFSQFYACFSSLLIKPEVGSYRHESTHSFGYGMKLLLI